MSNTTSSMSVDEFDVAAVLAVYNGAGHVQEELKRIRHVPRVATRCRRTLMRRPMMPLSSLRLSRSNSVRCDPS